MYRKFVKFRIILLTFWFQALNLCMEVASLCDNLHSTFYRHVRSQHSWDISLVLSMSHLLRSTRNSTLSWMDQANAYWSLCPALRSSQYQCTVSLYVSLAAVPVQPLPACSSEGQVINVHVIFFFPPTTWRVKDVNVQNGQVEQMEIQLVCPPLSPTDDWVTLSHFVTPHVICI